jgi:hypothetical protein
MGTPLCSVTTAYTSSSQPFYAHGTFFITIHFDGALRKLITGKFQFLTPTATSRHTYV